MTNAKGLESSNGNWLLPITGDQIVQCCFDFAITFRFAEGSELKVEQPMFLTFGDEAKALVAPDGTPELQANVLKLIGKTVSGATAFRDGRLELSFDDGVILSVPADEGFEAWNFVASGGGRVTSLPGGGLSVWE